MNIPKFWVSKNEIKQIREKVRIRQSVQGSSESMLSSTVKMEIKSINNKLESFIITIKTLTITVPQKPLSRLSL